MTLRKSWLVAAESALQGATALDGRLAHAGSYVRNSAGLVRAGVLGYRKDLVSTRSDMALDVGAFEAVLTRGAGYGATPIANDGTIGVALPASPSSNSRWVRVYAVQHDNIDAADADNEPVLTYVAGNAAASPSLPALPVGALPIARILQPANVLGTADCVVVEEFPMTAAVGGVVPFRSKSELDAWTDPVLGQHACVVPASNEYSYVAGAWGIRLEAYWQGNPGSSIAGIVTPTAADMPSGFIMKAGQLTTGTTVAFGNEYFSVITFATPFPTRCLGVSLTPLSGSPTTRMVGSLGLDTMNAANFRALITESGTAYVRGFSWLAWGY
ncbi:hypothetical protein C5E11_03845 [Clavibacter michiganensis]|nr:hypothetical protein [Clavibacter michiganensis]PPF64534.1 hypothetical protein C5E11_03845 [Clavibacter michiganensis]